MAAKKDYYETLGIDRNADAAAIKKAYRKLAKKYHPDMNKDDPNADERFKEITEAYNVLSDEEKKKLYDRFGHAAFDETAGASDFYRNPGGTYQEFHFEGDDMDDLFSNLFGQGFNGHGFNGSGFRGFGQNAWKRRGQDVTAQVTVSFEEAVFGCEKVIHFQSPDRTSQSLQVHIPAGIDSHKKIRLKGKGMPGSGGAPSGDLLLEVIVKDKPGFERKGNDVYTTASIPFVTAALGGEAVVPTLYGNVSCKIPAGTQSGSKIRLRGKGIASMDHPNIKGDQYVTIQIQVPRNISPEAGKKLREFQAIAS